jgi:hypothetical protein
VSSLGFSGVSRSPGALSLPAKYPSPAPLAPGVLNRPNSVFSSWDWSISPLRLMGEAHSSPLVNGTAGAEAARLAS